MADITSPIMLDSTGQGIITALGQIKDAVTGPSAADVTYDGTTSGLSADDVQEAIDELASEKQDTLTFDASPIDNSSNPVTSDGVYDAIQGQEQLLKDTVGWIGKNLLDPDMIINGALQYVPVYVGDGVFTLSSTCPQTSGALACIFLLAGSVQTGATTSDNGVWNGQSRTVTSVNGYITVASRTEDGINPKLYNTQLEKGSTATSYEPYHVSVEDSLAKKANASALGTVENGPTVSQAYAVGEHFSRFGDFCNVTQPIASGGTLIEGTNYSVGSVASSLVKQATFSGTTSAGGNVQLYNGTDRHILVVESDNENVGFLIYIGSNFKPWARAIAPSNQPIGETAVSGTYYYI